MPTRSSAWLQKSLSDHAQEDARSAESFYSSMKNERILKKIYKTRKLALADITDYIE